MSNQENNKLIAEFMGLIIRDKDGNLPTSSQQHKLFVEEEWDKLYFVSPYSPNGLDYHESWDWLMPVVEKIEQVHEGVPQELINLSLFSTRDEVYKAVVEFINQFNK